MVDSFSHYFFFQLYQNQVSEARSTDTDTGGQSESSFSSEGEDDSVFNLTGLLLSVSQKPKTRGILVDKGFVSQGNTSLSRRPRSL